MGLWITPFQLEPLKATPQTQDWLEQSSLPSMERPKHNPEKLRSMTGP
jgi:hypothetical protein